MVAFLALGILASTALTTVTTVSAAESSIAQKNVTVKSGTLDDMINDLLGNQKVTNSELRTPEITSSDLYTVPSGKSPAEIKASLSASDLQEFKTLSQHFNWSPEEQNQILSAKDSIFNDPATMPRWKVAAVKAVVKAAAKVLGAKLG